MGTRPLHGPGYHEWARSTPVADAIVTVIAVASIVIGGYALLFLVLAAANGDADDALANALFLVCIGLVNGLVDTVRWWRRHHG
jgi:hypothetical protein